MSRVDDRWPSSPCEPPPRHFEVVELADEALAHALALAAGDDLPPAEAQGLDRHLQICPVCRRHLESLRRSRDWSASPRGGAAVPDPGEAFFATLRGDVLAATKPGDRRAPVGWPGRWRWALAALLLLTLGAVLFWRIAGPSSRPAGEPLRVAAAPRPDAAQVPDFPASSPPELSTPEQPELSRSEASPRAPDLATPSGAEATSPDSRSPAPRSPVLESLDPEPVPGARVLRALLASPPAADPATPSAPGTKVQLADGDLVIYWTLEPAG